MTHPLTLLTADSILFAFRAMISPLVLLECGCVSVRPLAGIGLELGPTMCVCFAQMASQLVNVPETHIARVTAIAGGAVHDLVRTFLRCWYLLRPLREVPSARCLYSLWDDAVRRSVSANVRF